MSWYRVGKINLTKSSVDVVGVGTSFKSEIRHGDILLVGGVLYEIARVESDTALKLTTAYTGNTVAGSAFAVIRNMTNASNFDLMRKIEEFLSDRQRTLDEFTDWLAGEATGGPASDGKYPLTDRYGVTTQAKSIALLVKEAGDLGTLISQAEAKLTALGNQEAWATQILGYKNAAETAASTATSKAAAASTSATNAATSATTATTQANTAKTQATTATTKASEASASATASAGSATESAASATSAASSASTATTKASQASTSATTATTKATEAGASATKAGQWAEANEGVAVETGKYSAKHHAIKAAASATSASTSATTAATKASEASTSATTATTKAGEASTSAATSTTKAGEASSSATAAATSATAAATSTTKAQQWADANEGTAVESGKYSAKHHALKAAASATSASSSASTATTKANDAGSSATAAAGSATAAASSASTATTKANEASTSASTATGKASDASASATAAASSASSASTSSTKAGQWAEANEGVAVETGKYSAKHHAIKAAASATAASGSASTASTKATQAGTSATNAASSASGASTSASTATTKANEAKNSATAAAASETAASTKASESASSAAASASSATASAASEVKASKWADANEGVAVESGKYSAKHHALKAAASASTAAGSASTATTKAGEASTSASNASSSATAAATSATAATTKAGEAAASATSAATHASTATTKANEASASATAAAGSASTANTKASQASASATAAANSATASQTAMEAAEAARDEAVSSAAVVTGALVELGSIDLSSGAPPAKPKQGAFWKVTTGGTIDGIDYGAGDTLVYSKNLDSFYKIDNTESVSSVNGKQGVVVLTKTDVGLPNVANVDTTNAANISSGTLPSARLTGSYPISITGAAATVTSRTINGTAFNGSANITTANWGTSRTLSFSGDATGSASVNGSANVNFALSLVASGVAAGIYSKVTVDEKGRVTAGASLVEADIPALSAAKITSGTLAAARIPAMATSKITGLDAALASKALGVTKITAGEGLSGGGTLASDTSLAISADMVPATASSLGSSIDLNDVIEPGFYYQSTNAATSVERNYPASGLQAGSLVVTKAAGVIQEYTTYAPQARKFIRGYHSSAWSAWKEVHTEGVTLSASDIPNLNASKITSGTLAAARIPTLNQSTTGNAATATKLATARTISLAGDATGSMSFDGSANASAELTLANSGVTAGTYKSVVVDAKGRVTSGSEVVTGLVTSSSATGVTNVATTNTNTFLNITEKVGTATASAGTSTQVTGAGTVTIASDTAGKITITGAQTITGNAGSATKLATARTVNGTSFDGSGNITTANWGTARTLTVGDTGKSVNGAANVSWTIAEIGAAPAQHTHPLSEITDAGNVAAISTNGSTANYLRGDGTWVTPPNTTYSQITEAEITTGTSTTSRLASASRMKFAVDTHGLKLGTTADTAKAGDWVPAAADIPALDAGKITSGVFNASRIPTLNQSTTGNAATATKLQTARTINGVSFDGSANITVADSTKLPLAGGTLTGTLNAATFNATSLTGGGFQGIDADTAAQPSFTWTADLNTGIFRPAADVIGFTAGGAERGRVNTTGFSGNGSQLTALNASNLSSGTVPNARMSGLYDGITLKINGANTVFTTPSSGTASDLARTVFGLAEFRGSASATVGAIVFIAPTTASTIMHEMEIAGLLYNQNIVRMTIQGYRTTGAWSATRKISTGTVDVPVRWGLNPDGKACVILGDVTTSWSYPHFSIIRAMFSHTSVADSYCSGWTTGLVTDLTGYTQISGFIADSPVVGSVTGNAATATKLATARTIGGVSFDGTANINLPGVNAAGNQSTSGNAATATKLATARTINGTSFDGSANITITAAANGGTSAACSGNAATATKLATARTINGTAFDGSGNITITAAANGGTSSACSGNAATATKLATARTINGVSFDGSGNITITAAANGGTSATCSGNAATATTLATARTINGVSFNGSANITVADATKLPLTGGTVTGTTIFSGTTASTSATTGSLQCRGGIGVSGAIYAGGNITAYSDIRLKKDVERIPDALAKVIQLNGVTYTRKDSGERHTGLIAQDVQKVLPEAVSGDEYLGVAYGNLVGLLVEAIKEQQARIEDLERRITA